MNGIRLLLEELKAIMKDKHLLIPIMGVSLIPLLYAGMFLWAFWDPYDKMEQLPVAVVNSDVAVVKDGKTVAVGDEFIKKLKKNNSFEWKFVSLKEAKRGLEDRDYYVALEIPANFSKNATTLTDEKPKKMALQYVPNESYNFLAAQIGGTAMDKLKEKIGNSVREQYVDTLMESIDKAADGAKKINDGATKLADNTPKLADGLQTMADATATMVPGLEKNLADMEKLNDGTTKLAAGLQKLNGIAPKFNQLADGTATLRDGLTKLQTTTKSVVPQFIAGSDKLSAGATKAKDGMAALQQGFNGGATQLAGATAKLGESTTKLSGGLTQIQTNLTELQKAMKAYSDKGQAIPAPMMEKMTQLVAALGQVNAGATQLNNAVTNDLPKAVTEFSTKVNGGMTQLSDGLTQLAAGQAQFSTKLTAYNNGISDAQTKLVAGATKLADGSAKLTALPPAVAQLADGATKIADGTTIAVTALPAKIDSAAKLVDGIAKVNDGAQKLDEGAHKLADGTTKLADKLADGASHRSKQMQKMFAAPVVVEKKPQSIVPNYGTGFAPYFLSLGLYVGALLLSIVFPLIEPKVQPRRALGWMLSKSGVLAIVGIAQSLIMNAVMIYGLGIEVENTLYFYLFSLVTSFTFLALVQMLVTTLGNPGRFIAIFILIMQLTTSAGTFPLELIPEPLQVFNKWLPMTYSVEGYKAIISSGQFSVAGHAVLILVGFIGLCLLLTLGYFRVQLRKLYGAKEKQAA